MTKQELKRLIEDDSESFLKKLKHAGLNELEYWEGPGRADNLPRELLIRFLQSLDENREFYPDQEIRESPSGKYGETGFDWIFKFEYDFEVMGNTIRVYVKGFFFEINDPRGVEIQSFKKATPKLKLVKQGK